MQSFKKKNKFQKEVIPKYAKVYWMKALLFYYIPHWLLMDDVYICSSYPKEFIPQLLNSSYAATKGQNFQFFSKQLIKLIIM